MEEISAFIDKNILPNEKMVAKAIGKTFLLWKEIHAYVLKQYPGAIEEWNYPGVKYGWSFRLKDKKRAILYLLPREHFFKVAFVFGQKSTDIILQSDIADSIKKELQLARAYAEGRGIRIDIKSNEFIKDIKFLIDTKLSR